MLQTVVAAAPLFLLVAVRCFALILTVPLLSTRAVSRVVKVALAGYTAFLVFPSAYPAGWDVAAFSLDYVFILLGEAMIGVITGFFITMIFAAFSSAGQFFTYQMGFGASEVYDALAQIENPLMGQYLNLIAMLLFLQVNGFQTLFLGGIFRSFQTFNSFSLLAAKEEVYRFVLSGLTSLFFDALIISLPMVGTLFLVSVCTGLISKAAPQMNLLSEGLPISILTAFFLLSLLLPTMSDFFIRSFDTAFLKLESFLTTAGSVQI